MDPVCPTTAFHRRTWTHTPSRFVRRTPSEKHRLYYSTTRRPSVSLPTTTRCHPRPNATYHGRLPLLTLSSQNRLKIRTTINIPSPPGRVRNVADRLLQRRLVRPHTCRDASREDTLFFLVPTVRFIPFFLFLIFFPFFPLLFLLFIYFILRAPDTVHVTKSLAITSTAVRPPATPTHTTRERRRFGVAPSCRARLCATVSPPSCTRPSWSRPSRRTAPAAHYSNTNAATSAVAPGCSRSTAT